MGKNLLLLLILCRVLQLNGEWADFKYPAIRFEDRDSNKTAGAKLFHKVIPDLNAFIRENALLTARQIYQKPAEVPAFDTLIYIIEDYDGVSAKFGEPPVIGIQLSTRYIENLVKKEGEAGLLFELKGILVHELVHAYQHSPKGAGEYRQGDDFFGFIEGIADGIRADQGLFKDRSPKAGGHWNDGYNTSGYFISWIVKKYNKDFVYLLNKSAKENNPWSWNQACTQIVGKEVKELWDEYQKEFKSSEKK